MKPVQKTIKVKEDYYIDFTDEELEALNLEKGQKYTCEIKDGALKLTPFVKMELNMGDWDKDLLLYLIQESCERDVSVNEVISNTLEQIIKENVL